MRRPEDLLAYWRKPEFHSGDPTVRAQLRSATSMQFFIPPTAAIALVFLASCTSRTDAARSEAPVPSLRRLEGRLMLPPGDGIRGIDVELRFSLDGEDVQTEWATPEPSGEFGRAIDRLPDSVVITAGAGFELLKLPASSLPEPDLAGVLDLGELRLGERLMRYTLRLEPAPDAALGLVRVAMWSGPPPPSVALGSRQFPPVSVGTSQEWLVPSDAEEIYFLVERPRDPDPAAPWWEGAQQRFGPFTAESLPAALTLD